MNALCFLPVSIVAKYFTITVLSQLSGQVFQVLFTVCGPGVGGNTALHDCSGEKGGEEAVVNWHQHLERDTGGSSTFAENRHVARIAAKYACGGKRFS